MLFEDHCFMFLVAVAVLAVDAVAIVTYLSVRPCSGLRHPISGQLTASATWLGGNGGTGGTGGKA